MQFRTVKNYLLSKDLGRNKNNQPSSRTHSTTHLLSEIVTSKFNGHLPYSSDLTPNDIMLNYAIRFNPDSFLRKHTP